MKLLLHIFIEAFVAVSLAGVILALAIPALGRAEADARTGILPTLAIVGVLVTAVAIALFRRGSAIRRYFDRSA